jgi:recombination protein RecA
MAAPDREKALDTALAQIDRQFGKGSVMRLGDETRAPIEVIPTGSIALDVALGIGGLPRGRVVELYGPEASGKSTLALHAAASAQQKGGIAAFIDAEHALDPDYAKKLGVDTDALLVSQPDTGEQALEIMDMLIRSGALDLVVVDSVAALVPRAEIEGEMGDAHVGLQARLMSQALRKITGALNTSKTTALFINQLREKVGVFFGSPETTTGGRALKFYSSVRLDVRRIETLKDGTDAVGNRTRVKVVKNKCLAEGTRIFDPVTGATHRVEDVVDQRLPIHVAAVDKAGRLHSRPIVDWFDQGEQPTVMVRLRGGASIRVTPGHKVLSESGWREVRSLRSGDLIAQPRQWLGFGDERPISADHARILGYLIGDGYVGGQTPVTFCNVQGVLKQDAARIAQSLGCEPHPKPDGVQVSFSHRRGEKNELLGLCRWAGIWGKLAWEKQIPSVFFVPNVDSNLVGNLLFGLLESDGWVTREETGAIRAGFTTTSEQLAHQVQWLLLRFGVASSVRCYDPTGKRPSIVAGRQVRGTRDCFEVRIAGVDNVRALSKALPTWGPRSAALSKALASLSGRHRGSQQNYLPRIVQEPVLAHLRDRGLSPVEAAEMLGRPTAEARSGLRQLLGATRIRRDRLATLADALGDEFLQEVLAEEVAFATVRSVEPAGRVRTFDIEVDELHNLVADHVVVHNCSPPFKQAEFDILYGHGISREGGLLDLGVEHGIVRKSGAWYTYDGDQLGQGKENSRNFLRDNADLASGIEKKIKEKLGIGPQVDSPADEASGGASGTGKGDLDIDLSDEDAPVPLQPVPTEGL